MNKKEMEAKISELEFKLKTLQNFVFEHHHKVLVVAESDYKETSKPKVWVDYPTGRKEEPK